MTSIIMSTSETQFAPGPVGVFIERLCTYLAYIGGALFITEAVMSVLSVIGRTFFSTPIPGDYELIQVFSAVGITMCMPYCQLRHGHVFVDFFTLWAPQSLKRYLDSFACLLLAICAFLLAWRSWDGMVDMREYQESSMVLGLPIWWGYLPIAPSFIIFGIAALYTMTFGWQKTASDEEVLV